MGALRCCLLGHAAMPTHYRNGETEFSLCIRCGDDLLRAVDGEEWAEVPAGHKVVWRRRDQGSTAAAVAERMTLPPAPRRHRPRHAAPIEARGQRRTRPYRAGVAMLVGLTGRFVMASIFDRLRRPARPVPQPVRLLPAPARLTAASRSRVRSRRG
ncbi:hypothetical protein P6144_03115 [Sphingomonas sp. HITSZ_GF]|uniref:hypothetical protein n=1 Tax=Sphingomonas sp. HITSZ_GF TaxID=3037247 RepID=UPI00240E3E87|nr:hypothetical protein [Sphingomonas sp. HITSZ_GF]MDG2532626.1 hypothetical protein [Sphingomonas sp. HITSZ_GF]